MFDKKSLIILLSFLGENIKRTSVCERKVAPLDVVFSGHNTQAARREKSRSELLLEPIAFHKGPINSVCQFLLFIRDRYKQLAEFHETVKITANHNSSHIKGYKS